MNYDQTRHLIRYYIVRYTAGKGIEFSDKPPMWGHFLGLRREDGLSIIAEESLDFVVAVMPKEINILEWWKRLKYGGYLVLADTADLSGLMNRINGWDRVENREIQNIKLTVYFKVRPIDEHDPTEFSTHRLIRRSFIWEDPKPKKTAAVVRYGGWGDIIQVSGVFVELKKQGYHVTCVTDSKAYQAVKYDPHIDDFVVHGRGALNGELGEYWATISQDYDRWINLVESTEGPLLTFPDRMPHRWPHGVRHMMCDLNYTEFIHSVAGVEFNKSQRFWYSTEEEKKAKEYRENIDGPVILWVIHNQAVNKLWPYVDETINHITKDTNYHIVIVGDRLKHDFVNQYRVISQAGTWNIRQSMTFACVGADIVIGPETGVLNACAMEEEVKKIVFMSHSSIKNLTKHWVNTISLTPNSLKCYPCHRLHNGFEYCNQDSKTGMTQCQAMISMDDVIKAVKGG